MECDSKFKTELLYKSLCSLQAWGLAKKLNSHDLKIDVFIGEIVGFILQSYTIFGLNREKESEGYID